MSDELRNDVEAFIREGHWWCPHCRRIKDGELKNRMPICDVCGEEVFWCDPFYAGTIKDAVPLNDVCEAIDRALNETVRKASLEFTSLSAVRKNTARFFVIALRKTLTRHCSRCYLMGSDSHKYEGTKSGKVVRFPKSHRSDL